MVETLAIDAARTPRWTAAARIAFRFSVVYFGTYVLLTQMLSSLLMPPFDNAPGVGELPPFRTVVEWTAMHVFRVTTPLVVTGSGSGDKTFDWVQAFCLLASAIVVAAAWSLLDRRRARYERADAWFRLFLRFALGSTMVTYGVAKVVPLQMGSVSLTRLIEPYGQFSPMGVLWAFIAASTAYQIATGAAELIAGVLLFLPRTATLGAIVALADAVQVFMLNMTYDVPVKLLSFHLIVISIVLLAPHARRIADVLLLGRPTGPAVEPPLGRTPRRRRLLVAAQVVFGVYIVVMNLYGARKAWYEFGGGAPESALHGIWTVETMAIDGVTRVPLVTDWGRWRRVVFDSRGRVTFQRMDDSFVGYTAQWYETLNTLTLTRGGESGSVATFNVTRPAREEMTLAGTMEDHRVAMRLQLYDRRRFLLGSRGFHWVQEYPFNR
ncbi:MAG: DoxX family protein [Acidobacteria bacterium]|nr:DoxX family protein [Acidobacteriota bacterium]